MASYHAVNDVLLALESFFDQRLPEELSSGPINARIELLGSSDITESISGNVLGIYLHRIEMDSGNPRDTVRGIAEWWLARQRYEDSMLKVKGALNSLCKQNLISKRELPG
jgi:hypothetical protein